MLSAWRSLRGSRSQGAGARFACRRGRAVRRRAGGRGAGSARSRRAALVCLRGVRRRPPRGVLRPVWRAARSAGGVREGSVLVSPVLQRGGERDRVGVTRPFSCRHTASAGVHRQGQAVGCGRGRSLPLSVVHVGWSVEQNLWRSMSCITSHRPQAPRRALASWRPCALSEGVGSHSIRHCCKPAERRWPLFAHLSKPSHDGEP
jgi:hypothetical protein